MREQPTGPRFWAAIAVVSCCIGLGIENTEAQAATFYVSASGDDSNDGTSASTAFRTINKAAKSIQSGDWVYVSAGTYSDAIDVDGIQGWGQPTRFIASSGVIVAAQWKVFNSNHITIEGFTFQDTTSRFLVWQGSYEGTVLDCTFSTGDEGLLIKDGSLTIDGCQIQNFTHDGIQVDGEARLTIRDSTISDCQESGLEVRKVANVVLDNCNVTGQTGDGIEVNVVTDEIDAGTVSGSWSGQSVPLVGSAGAVTFGGGAYVHGDLHRKPQYPVNGSYVSGTVHDMDPDTTFPSVDVGSAAATNDNGTIPQTDKGKDPLNGSNEFFLGSNDGVDLLPGTYYFTDLETKPNSELRVSGPTVIYVNGNVLVKGSVNNTTLDPRNFQLMVTGNSVEITAQADMYAAIYAPDATITMRGGADIHGMLIGGQLDNAGSVQIYPDTSIEDLAEELIPAPSSTTSPSPPSTWTSVASGELDISDSIFTGNQYGARLVTSQFFDSSYTDYSNNTEWGLYLNGSFDPRRLHD